VPNRTVLVELRAKVDGYTSKINQAAKSTDAFAKKAKDAQKSSESWRKVGLAGAALGAGVAVMVKKSIDAASNLAETMAKAGTVFGDAAQQISDFGDTASTKLGMSKQAAVDAATTFAVFGKSAGLAGSGLAGFSTELVTLAADMASFSNTSPEQAIEAIGAALRGESEPIRQYGVLLDDATLKARAMALAIYDGTGALTPQQRVLAAQAEILSQTADAQHDVERTADGLANTQRRLSAEFANAQAEMGEAMLPAATSITEALGGILRGFNALPNGLQTGTLMVAGFGAAALMAAPKLIAFNTALVDMGVISSGTGGKLAAFAGKLGVVAAAVVGLKVGSDAFRSWTGQVAVGTEEANAGIQEIAASGQVTDDMLRRLGGGVNTLGDALHNNLNMGFAEGTMAAGAWVASLGGILPWYDEAIPKSNAFFESVDAGLASMATESPTAAAQAAAAFKVVADEAAKQGISVDELSSLFPQYSAALKATGSSTSQVAAASESAGSAMARLGTLEYQVAAAAGDLKAAYKGLAHELSRAEALDAASSAMKGLKEQLNTTDEAFSGTSQEALDNRAAIRGTISAYADAAASMKDPKKQAEYLTGAIGTIRQAMHDAGASKGEIEKLLGPLIEVRDKAREAHQAAKDLDGTYRVTVEYQTVGRPPGDLHHAVHPAGGGYVTGPGTGTSDSIPAMLSNGEYVVRAAAVAKYGLAMLHRINAGRYARGGPVRRYAAGGAVAATAATVATGSADTLAQVARAVARLEAAKKALRDAIAASGKDSKAAEKARQAVDEARSRVQQLRQDAKTAQADLEAAQREQSYSTMTGLEAATAEYQRHVALLGTLRQGTVAYLAEQAELTRAQTAMSQAQAAADAEAAQAAQARADATAQAQASLDEAMFNRSLRGRDPIAQAQMRLDRIRGQLAGLVEGSAEWLAKLTEIVAAEDAVADAQQASADALARAAGTYVETDLATRIGEARAELEQLTKAWDQQAKSVQDALAGQAALLGSFDFAAAKQATEDVTAAEQELLDARRAVNMATSEDRPAALERLAKAERDVVDKRAAAAKASPTGDNILAGFRSKMTAMSSFRSNIETLAKRGVHPSILQQLISAGIDGGAEMAAALVAMTPAQLADVNGAQSQIMADAGAIGQISADQMYGAQIMAAGSNLIQIAGSQPIQLQLDSRVVYAGLLELARQSGGTLSWTSA